MLGRGVARDQLEQGRQIVIRGDRDLALESLEEIGPHLPEIEDQGRQPARIETDSQRVDRRLEQLRVDPLRKRYERRVGGDDVPAPVHGHRRVGLLRGEDSVECLPHRRQLRLLE